MPGTTISTEIAEPLAKAVRIAGDTLIVDLIDGRTISAPLQWYPRLFHATPEQRQCFEISPGGYGIHWPDVDEDLSVDGIVKGRLPPRHEFERFGMEPPKR